MLSIRNVSLLFLISFGASLKLISSRKNLVEPSVGPSNGALLSNTIRQSASMGGWNGKIWYYKNIGGSPALITVFISGLEDKGKTTIATIKDKISAQEGLPVDTICLTKKNQTSDILGPGTLTENGIENNFRLWANSGNCASAGWQGWVYTDAANHISLTGLNNEGETTIWAIKDLISAENGNPVDTICLTKTATSDILTTGTLTENGIEKDFSLYIYSGICSFATGDPHVFNLKGEKFDLAHPGRAPLVVMPADTGAFLKITGLVERLHQRICKYDMYFTEIQVSHLNGLTKNITVKTGSEEDNHAFHVMVGGKPRKENDMDDESLAISDHINPRDAKVATNGVRIHVDNPYDSTGSAQIMVDITQLRGRRFPISYLNIDVTGLRLASSKVPIGGLLGMDDHSSWSDVPRTCSDGHHPVDMSSVRDANAPVIASIARAA